MPFFLAQTEKFGVVIRMESPRLYLRFIKLKYLELPAIHDTLHFQQASHFVLMLLQVQNYYPKGLLTHVGTGSPGSVACQGAKGDTSSCPTTRLQFQQHLQNNLFKRFHWESNLKETIRQIQTWGYPISQWPQVFKKWQCHEKKEW